MRCEPEEMIMDAKMQYEGAVAAQGGSRLLRDLWEPNAEHATWLNCAPQVPEVPEVHCTQALVLALPSQIEVQGSQFH